METCEHLDHIVPVTPSADGCEDCLKIGATWVHLRLCENCGHVGCCDSSPNRHATKHFHASSHPVIRSHEPGEDRTVAGADPLSLEPLREELQRIVASAPEWDGRTASLVAIDSSEATLKLRFRRG